MGSILASATGVAVTVVVSACASAAVSIGCAAASVVVMLDAVASVVVVFDAVTVAGAALGRRPWPLVTAAMHAFGVCRGGLLRKSAR